MYLTTIENRSSKALLLRQDSDPCFWNDWELEPLGYAAVNPVSFVDPTGKQAGDVLLYKSDGSDPARAIHWLESKLHPSAENIYTHSSIELKNGDQFTAHKDHGNGVSGSWVIDSRSDIFCLTVD